MDRVQFAADLYSSADTTHGKLFTHVPLLARSILWYQRKLGGKQAHHAMHWPRLCPWSCNFGWCTAQGQKILHQHHPMDRMAWEGLHLHT